MKLKIFKTKNLYKRKYPSARLNFNPDAWYDPYTKTAYLSEHLTGDKFIFAYLHEFGHYLTYGPKNSFFLNELKANLVLVDVLGKRRTKKLLMKLWPEKRSYVGEDSVYPSRKEVLRYLKIT